MQWYRWHHPDLISIPLNPKQICIKSQWRTHIGNRAKWMTDVYSICIFAKIHSTANSPFSLASTNVYDFWRISVTPKRTLPIWRERWKSTLNPMNSSTIWHNWGENMWHYMHSMKDPLHFHGEYSTNHFEIKFNFVNFSIMFVCSVPFMKIEGPLIIVQLLETTFLTLVNYARYGYRMNTIVIEHL